jgi:hypothetical protein
MSLETLYRLPLVAFLAITLTSCNELGDDASRLPSVSAAELVPLEAAFDVEGLLGSKESVVVQAMLESNSGVNLRARATGLESDSVRPRAFGLRVLTAHKNAEVGTAFFTSVSIYPSEGSPDRIVVDRLYLYGDGFASPDVIEVTEKRWSEQYSATTAEINQLCTLAEAVRDGGGAQPAYEATRPGGSLFKWGAEEQGLSQRTVKWLLGRQDVANIVLHVGRSGDFGNRLEPVFLAP